VAPGRRRDNAGTAQFSDPESGERTRSVRYLATVAGRARLRLPLTFVGHRLGRAVAPGTLMPGLLLGRRLTANRRLTGTRLGSLVVSIDDAAIMLGVLKVILGRDTIAHGIGVAGEQEVFFENLGRTPPDFHIGAIAVEGLVARVLAPTPTHVTPVSARPFRIETWSHDCIISHLRRAQSITRTVNTFCGSVENNGFVIRREGQTKLISS